MIDKASDILAHLRYDATFMSYVGLYDFGEGNTEDALVILGANQQIPGVKEISGLEVVINRIPDTTSKAVLSGCVIRQKVWTLYLVQYENSTPDVAVQAADRICAMAPGTTYSQLGTGFSDMAGIDQIVVKIPAHTPLMDLSGADADGTPPADFLWVVWDPINGTHKTIDKDLLEAE